MKNRNLRNIKWITVSLILIGLLVVSSSAFAARSTLHPVFAFLDVEGENVLLTNNAVSAMETCGQCHDTAFIANNSFHATAGLDEFGEAAVENTEMNCFLCHLSNPNNDARLEVLARGNFDWASTATLISTGLVSESAGGFVWNVDAFSDDGELLANTITIQDPGIENCGQCHGTVHIEDEPLIVNGCEDTGNDTSTTGQIFSAQRLKDTAMNLSNKDGLTRSFDIHIERGLDCVDCHYSLNNPVYANGQGADSLEHLDYDPRGLEIGEYLLMPSHEFARSGSSTIVVGGGDSTGVGGCDSCHNPDSSHTWLPYVDTHMDAINCETCHIPQLYAPAIQAVDNTVVHPSIQSNISCRGVEGNTGSIADLITGFEPAILLQENQNGDLKFSPYNLITTWFWIDEDIAIDQGDLEKVFKDGQDEILAVFDEDLNGEINNNELVLNTAEKVSLIADRLKALGYTDPQIIAETQPYKINHNVANGDWVVQDCEICHSDTSKMTNAFKISDQLPGGVLPEFVLGTTVITDGEFSVGDDGAVYFNPSPEDQGNYIFGHNQVSWVDWFGVLSFIGVFMGVVIHGGLRVIASKKAPKVVHKTKRVYMYTFYERLWHWLQTFTILLLTFTGLIIHKPEMFGLFSFKFVVLVHNILAGILVANAALALFYNLVSGDIQRFLPKPQGFFNEMILQVKYYTHGIFKGEPHPEEKTREKRLNPLQKVTYFGILNVLLPLQVLTGIFMWGVQRWPEIAQALGGLPFLAPFHTLVAWTFSSFILAHVYLTTTAGHTALAGIQSMINGWDDVEIHSEDHQE